MLSGACAVYTLITRNLLISPTPAEMEQVEAYHLRQLLLGEKSGEILCHKRGASSPARAMIGAQARQTTHRCSGVSQRTIGSYCRCSCVLWLPSSCNAGFADASGTATDLSVWCGQVRAALPAELHARSANLQSAACLPVAAHANIPCWGVC